MLAFRQFFLRGWFFMSEGPKYLQTFLDERPAYLEERLYSHHSRARLCEFVGRKKGMEHRFGNGLVNELVV